MTLALTNQLSVFDFNNRLDFVDVVVASNQSYNVVRVEEHVFVRKVVYVFASFNAHHADLELFAEHSVFQLFANNLAQRTDRHFFEMEVLLEHFWNDERRLFLTFVQVIHEILLQFVIKLHDAVRECEDE